LEILATYLPRYPRRVALENIAETAHLVNAIGGADARHACAEAILTATAWWP